MKGPLMQMGNFLGYFKKSKVDGMLWLASFVGVVLTGPKYGIIITVVLTILTMTYRNYKIDFMELELFDNNQTYTGGQVILLTLILLIFGVNCLNFTTRILMILLQ